MFFMHFVHVDYTAAREIFPKHLLTHVTCVGDVGSIVRAKRAVVSQRALP